jgi:cyclase
MRVRPLIHFLAAVLLTALSLGCGRPSIPPPSLTDGDGTRVGTPQPLGPGLWMVPGGGGNSAVFETATGVVVVDPKFASSWNDLAAAIRTLTPKPVTHAIVTHFHDDHASAAIVLPPEVEIVAHEFTLREMRAWGYLRADGNGPPVKTRGHSGFLTLFSGADGITLLTPGPAHTGGDSFVVFHRARVMHAGDVFPDTMAPIVNIEGGGHGGRFAATLRTIVASVAGVDRVITGHGRVMAWTALAQYADFMTLLVDYVGREMGMGRDKVQVFRALQVPPAFAGYDLSRMFETLDEIDRSLRPRWQRIF